MANILRSALRQTDSEYSFVEVVVEGPVLRILAHEGINWDAVEGRKVYEEALRTYEQLGYLTFANFENLFGSVITEKRVVVSNAPATDPRSGGLPPGHPALHHFLGLPILKGTAVNGLIGLANRPGGYTDIDQDKIEVLCRAASALYDTYRRREREASLKRAHRQAEKALQRNAELAHSGRLITLGEMAAGIAHELNQPLTAIISRAEACTIRLRSPDTDTDRIRQNLQEVVVQAERAGKIISRLRNLARRREPVRSTVDLNQLVREAAALTASEMTLCGVRIRLELCESLEPIWADSIQIQQVVLNLLRNAIEVLCGVDEQECIVTITTFPSADGGIEVSVHDTGPGISPEDFGRVFDSFFSTKSEGIGIGLSISRSIIEAHGGCLWIDPAVERGTTFQFRIPVDAEVSHDG